MTDWLVTALRQHAEVAFFVTLAIGYALGKLRVGSFSLGAVTGTLLAGVLVGQLGVKVSPEVKQCFFVLFLFLSAIDVVRNSFRACARTGWPRLPSPPLSLSRDWLLSTSSLCCSDTIPAQPGASLPAH